MKLGLRPGLVTLALSLLTASAAAADTARPALDEWLGSRGIRDTRVLAAFAAVPRDVFLASDGPDRAFDDKPPPAGSAQVISQPYFLARMIEQLSLKPESRVLEVGTGTGYTAGLLGQLASEVFSVGVIPELATTARLRLTREGYQNVHVKLGDVALGWKEYGPYDAIFVSTIASRVPPTLIEQLVEGGVLVMTVGPPRGRQVLIRGVKKGFKLHAKEVSELRPATSDERGAGGQRKRSDGAASRGSDRANDVRDEGPARNPNETQSGR
ncbi:MAG: protein-L-isoaspartate O-methyltransferase [Candidatus Binatia bacterium]